MPRFIRLTRIEYWHDEEADEPMFEESDICVNTDQIAYVEERVVHLKDGTSFLCTSDHETIASMLTQN